jgi:DNA helicase HerA-like ATPase
MTLDPEFDLDALEALARSVEEAMDPENPAAFLGTDLAALARRIPAEEQVTPGAVVRLALLNDALCVVERALETDGRITEAELAYAKPLARETLKYLARFRRVYHETVDLERHGVGSFLEQHTRDGQKFGGKCKTTAWVGLSVCQRTATALGDPIFVEQFRDLMVRTLDDLFNRVGSGTQSEKAAIVAEIERLAPPARPEQDRREIAYCALSSAEVFHAVAHGAEVFEQDPFDIESIHADARERFARLVDRAGEAKFGKMLLVKGDAGSGKTHLMRAFRNRVHGEGLGFVGYLQMSTATANYGRYLLSNLIDSWDRPYWGDAVPTTALACLSDAVAGEIPVADRDRLLDEALPDEELDALVNSAADGLIAVEKYATTHVDVLRMMLYLQRSDPPRRARILKFLRCEELGPYDRRFVGGVAPFAGEEGPTHMLTQLGRLVASTANGALVLLVDQLEDIFHLDQAAARFRLAMDALRHVTDSVPTSVVVVACLDDFYTSMRGSLAKTILDRLEHDPEPIHLTTSRSADDIEQMVGRRLERLFDLQGVRVRLDEPLYPFRRDQLLALANLRSRDVLDWCRKHHEASMRAGRITLPADSLAPAPRAAPTPLGTAALEQAWNDHRALAPAPKDDDAERMRLLAWALEFCALEQDFKPELRARADSNYVDADFGSVQLTVGLCDKPSQGGHLGKQVDALAARAQRLAAIPLVLRSSEYPRPGVSQIAQKLKGILQAGGRKLTLTDAEWRLLHALQTFRAAQRDASAFDAWLREEKPLSGVTALRVVLDFAPPAPTAIAREAAPAPSKPAASRPRSLPPTEGRAKSGSSPAAASAAGAPGAELGIGETRGLTPHPVRVAAESFTTHAAFLGSTQSGKTTLALNILEQLLLEGVPVLMVDRKGDLATYATSEFWNSDADGASRERKRALRAATDVRVYTPGEPRGRALSLPVIPSGLDDVPAHERGMLARYAATALGAMMGYKKSRSDETRLSILGKAIELVGSSKSSRSAGIGALVSVLHAEDPDLVSSVGKLDPKHFHALVENLETLRLRYDHLLREDGERLIPEELFGLTGAGRARASNGAGGRPTRLSVISTKFIGDGAAIDFWVARLLGELSRWASRRPATSLQAVLFLDEADIYLPAQTKPATKEPILDLLKRARSAGLGVLLATQSPGDLDYRCRDNIRTWFVGRVAEKTAVDKMKPLLNDVRVNVGARLAQAKTGEFWKLQDGEAIEFKATPSLMRTSQLGEESILSAARGEQS